MYSFGAKYGERSHYGTVYAISSFGIREVKGINCKFIACGGRHIGCIDKQNRLFMFGVNEECQCGFPEHLKTIQKPKQLFLDEKIKTIRCGFRHTIIKSDSGNYYSCGRNGTNACLLFINKKRIESLHKISLDVIHKLVGPEIVVDLMPGRDRTLVVTK